MTSPEERAALAKRLRELAKSSWHKDLLLDAAAALTAQPAKGKRTEGVIYPLIPL